MKDQKYIAFDLDGVLCDCDFLHFQALNDALQGYGPHATITPEEHHTVFKGLPTRVKLRMLLDQGRIPNRGRVLGDTVQYLASIKQHYTVEAIKELRPEKGKCDLLSELKVTGWRIAVCSNAVRESVRMMLLFSGLLDFTEFYLSNEDAPPKPDPGMYLEAAMRFQISPCDLVVVEDSEPGKASALAARCRLVSVAGPEEVTLALLPRIHRAVGEHSHVEIVSW